MSHSVMTVVGARPQFVKAAMVSTEITKRGNDAPYQEFLVHTGQHYDENMSQVFFNELDMRPPDINLQVGSNSPGRQMADLMTGLEDALKKLRPTAVLAYGDTVSTLAAALTAALNDLPFIHVEAGERTFRRHQMPEETNRITADHCAGLCLTTTQRATDQLAKEWFSPKRVEFVGDTMYDLFLLGRSKLQAEPSAILEQLGVARNGFVLATIHRVENTSSQDVLLPLLEALDAAEMPVVLPIHPRVAKLLETWKWSPSGSLKIVPALGYFDLLALLLACDKVVTDSGGVTREAFFAGKPGILPVRNNAWQIIVESGWAVETGHDPDALAQALRRFQPSGERPNLFGDGNASAKIVDAVGRYLQLHDHDGPWHKDGWWREMADGA